MRELTLEAEAVHLQNLFGRNDEYVRTIEKDFQVTVTDRNGCIRIAGECDHNVDLACHLVEDLLHYQGKEHRFSSNLWSMELR